MGAFFVHLDKVTYSHICGVCGGCSVQVFQHILCKIVVAVHKAEPVSPGFFDSFVPCTGQAAVFLMENPDAGILPGIVIAHGGTAVRGAVVYEEHLEIRKGLVQNAVHALFQILLHLVYRYND